MQFSSRKSLTGKTTMQILMKNPISYAYASVQVPKSF